MQGTLEGLGAPHQAPGEAQAKGFLAPVLDLERGWEEGLSSGGLVYEGFSPPPKPTLHLTGAIHGLLLDQKQ